MFQIELDQLAEDHLRALVGTVETFRIEFKGQLDLSTQAKRQEAAKDVAALANSAGGRIFYGITERRQADGSRRADAIKPLTESGLGERLEDVVADTIHPRPHLRHRSVQVGGGYVLVVEVIPSLGRDLHMVITDQRFYRRGETRTILMSEPEIREAYTRIASGAILLEDKIAATIAEHRDVVTGQTLLVVPWFPRRGLADPRTLVGIGDELAAGPFSGYQRINLPHPTALRNMRVYTNGLRAEAPSDSVGRFTFEISRTGTIHLSDSEPVGVNQNSVHLISASLVRNLIATLQAARIVLGKSGYWGAVHVVQFLMLPGIARLLEPNSRSVYAGHLVAGLHRHEVPEVYIAEQDEDMESTARELCDQMFQALGQVVCPFFSAEGHLQDSARKALYG
jgi:hypothetical protein